MSTLSNTLAVTLALSLAGGIAAAQTPDATSTRGGDSRQRPRPPIDTALDANGDEIIDAGEIANAVAALKKLDSNGDGQLSPEEYRPPRGGGSDPGRGNRNRAAAGQPDQMAGAPPTGDGTAAQGGRRPAGMHPTGRRPLPPIVTALDTNGDGTIAADEIVNAVAALKKLDTSGDGALSPDEYRPPRPDGPGAPGGTGGPGEGQRPPGN